jgi:hypothetical protein
MNEYEKLGEERKQRAFAAYRNPKLPVMCIGGDGGFGFRCPKCENWCEDRTNEIKNRKVECGTCNLSWSKNTSESGWWIDGVFEFSWAPPNVDLKTKVYEQLMHDIQMYSCVSLNPEKLQRLIRIVCDWSYAHRAGNGEYTDEEQEQLINKQFRRLQSREYDNVER